MDLYYKKLGESRENEPLIIVHGLFGSSDNWHTLGKKFAEDYTVYLVDQRNHGKSPHSEEHSYDLMAEDLLELIREEQLMAVNLIGHSMGGKTVMKFAEKYEDYVNKMVVADIGPKKYESHHQEILDVLLAVNPSIISSRKDAEKILATKINNPSIRQFLLKNLYWKNPEELAWRMNVTVLDATMGNILSKEPKKEIEIETLFIRGGASNYIQDSDKDMIFDQFPNSKIKTIVGAGHWLHAEKPNEFYQLVKDFLDEY